jgi:hypothetical protein
VKRIRRSFNKATEQGDDTDEVSSSDPKWRQNFFFGREKKDREKSTDPALE